MIDTNFVRGLQEAGCIDDCIASFFRVFSIGTLLNKAGIKKLRGASPKALFAAIFLLPFIGDNFYRGIVKNDALGFNKDAAYALLRNPRHNWRSFLLGLAKPIIRFMEALTREPRVKVFVIDDTVYDRRRSKKVELLSWVFDHVSGKSLKGFKMLTLGWDDGVSFVPLDFVLGAATDPEKRVCGITRELHHRSCGARRRQEALRKATELLLPLLNIELLAFERRCHDDPRTLGSLFYACCEEQKDLGFLEALGRLLAEVVDTLRQAGQVLETAMMIMVDALVSAAVDMLGNKRRFSGNNIVVTEGEEKSES